MHSHRQRLQTLQGHSPRPIGQWVMWLVVYLLWLHVLLLLLLMVMMVLVVLVVVVVLGVVMKHKAVILLRRPGIDIIVVTVVVVDSEFVPIG